MKKLINLLDIRSENYDKCEYRSTNPCLICGRDVSKIEEKFDEFQKSGEFSRKTPRFLKWYKANYIHMDTDGNLYFVDEDVAEGHESQGCFAVGCRCLQKYRALREAQG